MKERKCGKKISPFVKKDVFLQLKYFHSPFNKQHIMKNIFKLMGIAFMACATLFVGCQKDNNNNNPTTDGKYTITVKSNNDAWGTVTGGGTYTKDTTITITANAKAGYVFVNWDDNSTDAKNATRSIKVTGNATYTAIFEAKPEPPAASVSATLDGTPLAINDYEALTNGSSIYLIQAGNEFTSDGRVKLPVVLFTHSVEMETGSIELFNETLYEIEGEQYGDWQLYGLTNYQFNFVDATNHIASCDVTATMWSLTDIAYGLAENEEDATHATLTFKANNIAFEVVSGKVGKRHIVK